MCACCVCVVAPDTVYARCVLHVCNIHTYVLCLKQVGTPHQFPPLDKLFYYSTCTVTYWSPMPPPPAMSSLPAAFSRCLCSLPLQLIPTVHDQTHIYVGLIVGVCVGVFFIICCCLLWGCICCWERRRRRTYQKRIGEFPQAHIGGGGDGVVCRCGRGGRGHLCAHCFEVLCTCGWQSMSISVRLRIHKSQPLRTFLLFTTCSHSIQLGPVLPLLLCNVRHSC